MADFVSESHVFSPRHPSAFTGFSTKTSADTDSARSPTSPLDLVFSTLKNPFGFGCQKPLSSGNDSKRAFHCSKIGLGIVNSLADNGSAIGEVVMRPQIKMTDRSKNVVTSLPAAISRGAHVNDPLVTKPSSLPSSAREIELSEDYTCVICHGPNPKTTHIFGDCILECHSNGDQLVVFV